MSSISIPPVASQSLIPSSTIVSVTSRPTSLSASASISTASISSESSTSTSFQSSTDESTLPITITTTTTTTSPSSSSLSQKSTYSIGLIAGLAILGAMLLLVLVLLLAWFVRHHQRPKKKSFQPASVHDFTQAMVSKTPYSAVSQQSYPQGGTVVVPNSDRDSEYHGEAGPLLNARADDTTVDDAHNESGRPHSSYTLSSMSRSPEPILSPTTYYRDHLAQYLGSPGQFSPLPMRADDITPTSSQVDFGAMVYPAAPGTTAYTSPRSSFYPVDSDTPRTLTPGHSPGPMSTWQGPIVSPLHFGRDRVVPAVGDEFGSTSPGPGSPGPGSPGRKLLALAGAGAGTGTGVAVQPLSLGGVRAPQPVYADTPNLVGHNDAPETPKTAVPMIPPGPPPPLPAAAVAAPLLSPPLPPLNLGGANIPRSETFRSVATSVSMYSQGSDAEDEDVVIGGLGGPGLKRGKSSIRSNRTARSLRRGG